VHPTPASGEQRRVPREEALCAQRLVVVLRRIEHHLDDAFHASIRGLQPADVDAKPARDGRAHLAGVEFLAFDLAAFQDVFGESAKHGFLFHSEAERLHLAEQPPLAVPGCSERDRQPPVIPTELRPVRKLMDKRGHSPHVLR
jgi:hypothetical protein